MLVSEIATRVRRQFGDTAGNIITDNAILDWINDGQREIARENNLLQVSASQDSVLNQADYPLPVDMLLLYGAKYNNVKLDYMKLIEADARGLLDPTQSAGVPTAYTIYGLTLTLIPKPSVAVVGGIKILYTRTPTLVTATGNTPELPLQFHNRIVEYCLAMAADLDDDYWKYQTKISEFRNNTQGMIDDAEHEPNDTYGQMGVPAMDSAGWTYYDRY